MDTAQNQNQNQNQQQAVCGKEALDLLNCIAQSPYDQDKCISLLQSLRQCVLNKKVKKFSLADKNNEVADSTNNNKQT